MKKNLLFNALLILGFSITFNNEANAYCGQATQTAVTSIDNTSAVLEWTPISGIIEFNIRYHKIGATSWNYATSATSSLEVSDLDPNVSYEYQVQTVCNGATSAFTETNKFTTLVHPNIPPVTQAANVTTGSTANISWTAVPGACSYQVQLKPTSSNGWTTINNVTSTSYSLRNLTPCTNYQYRVRTVCPNFTSTYSNVISFLTTCPTTGNTQSSSRLGSENVDKNLEFIIYPNPVHEIINIEFNSTKSGNINTKMYNMIGNVVMSSPASMQEGNNVLNFNTTHLAGGIYFFEIENNGEIIRKKFMVGN